jgi:hypothetical protein
VQCGPTSRSNTAGWDREILAIELQGLIDLDFEIELTGFSLAEVDIVLDEARESAPDGADAAVEDSIPTYRDDVPAVSQTGDLWLLGRHKLICGDARDKDAYTLRMTEQKDARETLIYNKKEFEKNLERCIKAMEADPDDLELRRRHKKLTQIIEWIGRGAPFTG